MAMLVINVYYGGNIQNTLTGVGYDIGAAYTFSVPDDISFAVLKREIYVGLGLFSSRFKLTIRIRMNTAPPGSFYFSLFRIENEELWDTIKQNAAQLVGFRVIELVVEAHRRTDQTNYDPCPDSLPGGSNTPPVQTDYDPWAGSTPVPNYTTPVQNDYDL